MSKSFNLKKTLYDSSTVAQIAEPFEPNTVLQAFHTIQPCIFCCVIKTDNALAAVPQILPQGGGSGLTGRIPRL